MNYFKELWQRLKGETSPFFVVLRNIMLTIAGVAGAVWALHQMEIDLLPEKWIDVCGKIAGIALAIGMTSQATKPPIQNDKPEV